MHDDLPGDVATLDNEGLAEGEHITVHRVKISDLDHVITSAQAKGLKASDRLAALAMGLGYSAGKLGGQS